MKITITKMDDELEKLLHELAGQERERLRNKYSKQAGTMTSHNKNRWSSEKSLRSFSYSSSTHDLSSSYVMTSENGDKYSKEINSLCQQMYPKRMTYFPSRTVNGDTTQEIHHNYPLRYDLNSELATVDKHQGFQLYSRYSHDFCPINAQYSQDLSQFTQTDLAFESKFARNLLYKDTDDTVIQKRWHDFR